MENNNKNNSTSSLSAEDEIKFLMYKEHMASTVSFAKDIVRFAFILNGAAGSALLAADKTGVMKTSLVCFGIGTLLATLGAACVYFYQYSVTMSWQKELLGHGGYENKNFRCGAICSLAMSLFFFIVGGVAFL